MMTEMLASGNFLYFEQLSLGPSGNPAYGQPRCFLTPPILYYAMIINVYDLGI